MAEIDDRVISMSFENTKFINGVSSTMSSLDKLNAALKKAGAENGLDNIEKSANKITFGGLGTAIDRIKAKFGRGFPEADQAFSEVEKGSGKIGFTPLTTAIDRLKGHFAHIPDGADQAFSGVESSSGKVSFQGLSQAIDGLGGKFSVLEGAAAVAFGNIASKAAMAGTKLVKSLAVNPITDGFHEYETQLNAVQTILSNTKASGAGLKDVNKALNELNHYADKTIYNFTEMAKNIGTFTAAGVDLKTATGSIKGIANLAALSGSNSQQASTAMYQLSQAISSGRVSLQDWNSVVNAGMGGTVFQRALAQTAEKMGTLDKGAVSLKGKMKNVTIEGKSFRESVMSKPGQDSWLTSKVLTSTLQQLSGDMTDAQLKAQGFSAAQIKSIQAQAKMAVNAATQVKTLSGLMDTTKEAVGSGWAQTWQIIFGDFGEAKHLFTGLSNAIGGFVGNSAKARNSVLKDWKDLGGRTLLIKGIKQAFEDLKAVVKPITDAFRDIFPRKTGQDLYNMTVQFKGLMDRLKIGPETADNLKRTFKGLFAVLDVGKQIVGGIFTAIGHLLGAVGHGSGGLLSFTGNVGDLLTALDEWLKKGAKLHTFFAGLGDILGAPIRLIGTLTDKLRGLFGGGNKTAGMHDSIAGMGDALKPATKAADAATKAWDGFLHVIGQVRDAMKPVVGAIGTAFNGVGDAISNALSNQNFDGVFKVIQTGLIAGIFLTIKRALGGGLKINFGGSAIKGISGVLDTLNGSLKQIQTNLKAATLVEIGAALALLTASAVALSLIKPEKLASAMTALAVGLGQLIGAMALLTKLGASGVKMTVIASSIVILAGAMDVMSVAILVLSRLSWEELAKGLSGIAGSLAIFIAASTGLSKASPRMIIAGAGIGALGAGLLILSASMKVFATMSWGDMVKGLAGVVLALGAIAATMQLMPLNMPIVGAGLVLVGIGLTAISGAVRIFATMDWGTLAKGISGVAASLVVIALAMSAMPPTLPLTAASLILVGIALTSVAGAIGLMGSFNLGTIVKGIAGLAGALLVLAGGLTLMVAALPGAAALLVASAALAIFVPVMGMLGTLKWTTIIKGLAGIALAFGVLAVGGALAAAPLAALGVGLGILGVGVLALGAGVKLLADGVSILAGKGAKGFAVFTAAVTALIAIFPKMVIDFVKGLVEIVSDVAKLAPAIVTAIVTIAGTLLTGLIALAPKAALAIGALITAMLSVLTNNAGKLITAGATLFLKLLSGIASHITEVTRVVGDIIAKFLSAVASKIGSIIAAGANILVQFLKGVANNLGRVVSSAGTIIAKYVEAIAGNVGKLVRAGADIIIHLLSGIASKIGEVVSKGADVIVNLVSGIGSNAGKVATAGTNAMIKFVNAVVKEALKLGNAGARAVVNLLNGVADAINKYEPQIIHAGVRIGEAIVSGMVRGLAPGRVIDAAKGLADHLPKWAKKVLGIHSPSAVFAEIGGFVVQGLANGMMADLSAHTAAENISHGVIGKFQEIFQTQSPSKVMKEIGEFVGKGFIEGLTGTSDDIDNAMIELQGKLSTTLQNSRDALGQSEAHLDALLKHHSATSNVVKQASAAVLASYQLTLTAKSAHDGMVKTLDSEKNKLKGLANEYDGVVKRLDDAKNALETITRTRDDAFKTISDQYSTLPSISMEDKDGKPVADQVGAYNAALAAQVTATQKYKDTLDQLRALGLDDATYQKLLSEGPADQTFASQLLAGGATAVAGINSLDAQLANVSQGLAYNASRNLYQAGVDAAQGIVNGLQSQKTSIENVMAGIANAMVAAIKKKLHIKSPSREFAEVGEFSARGLVEGFRGSSKMVSDAAASVGDDALAAMRSSVAQMSQALTDEMDSDPTITPILDLTKVKEDAKKMADMTNVVPITAATSFGQASAISAAELDRVQELVAAKAAPPVLKFEQNNTSPKALTEAEIYRQTNNQLAQAKAALGL